MWMLPTTKAKICFHLWKSKKNWHNIAHCWVTQLEFQTHAIYYALCFCRTLLLRYRSSIREILLVDCIEIRVTGDELLKIWHHRWVVFLNIAFCRMLNFCKPLNLVCTSISISTNHLILNMLSVFSCERKTRSANSLSLSIDSAKVHVRINVYFAWNEASRFRHALKKKQEIMQKKKIMWWLRATNIL